ncbi:MAG: PVC-type heme-binding CxxCH protein [Pirellulales bacterium]
MTCRNYGVVACLGLAFVSQTVHAEIERPKDAPPALSPEETTRLIHVPEGFRVELVASEPLIREPSGVCWDERGRLFVCELHGYNLEGQYDIEELNKTGQLDRVVQRIQANDGAKRKAEDGTYGTVKVLYDTDGDGRMDRVEVWADRLPPCYGICPARGGVIVACAPDIIYLADRDGNGRAEVHEVLFTGFPTGALERGISAPQWGYDDWIYVGAGHGGGTISGPRLKQPVNLPNSDFRIKADGSLIEPISGRTGTFGFSFTESGERFVVNTRSPLLVAALPWRYLARNPDAAAPALEYSVLPYHQVFPRSQPHPWRARRAQDPAFSKFYTDRYGSEEATPNGFFTSSCSPLVYQDAALPGLHGQLFVCEPAQNLVHRAILERDGSSLSAHRVLGEEQSEFLASSDPWFHPMALSHGPEGAIWIVDFYREIIEDYSAIPRYLQQQYGLHNGHDRGRIYRLVHNTTAMPPTDMSRLADDELVDEVSSPLLWRRQTARRLLVERGGAAPATSLAEIVRTAEDPATTLNALHTLDALSALENDHLKIALTHPAPSVRVHALRLMDQRFNDAPVLLDAALRLVDDPNPRVHLQLALSLGESHDRRVLPTLCRLAREHGEVRWLHDAILSSLAGRAGEMLTELLRENEIGPALALVEPLCAAIAARRNPQEMSNVVLQIAAARAPAVQVACLRGFRSRVPEPISIMLSDGARQAFKGLTASDDEDVRAAAQSLVGVLRIESPAERHLRLEKAAGEMVDPQLPLDDRLAAIAELATEQDSEITAMLIQAFTDGTPPIRDAILEALFRRRDRLTEVVAALENGVILASALNGVQRASLLENSDSAISERAAKLLKAPSHALEAHLPRFVAALEVPRDAARGEIVFREKCANCHQAHGVGHAVGPDLASEFQRAEETIIRDILTPSAVIASGYTTYIVETTAGLVHTGLIAGESANSIHLREPEGKHQTILRKDIASLNASSVSLMPEDLHKTLNPQQLADALAWLRRPPTRVVLIDDDATLATVLSSGDGKAQFVTTDKLVGQFALRITPLQRHSPRIPGWSYRIREEPTEGEYRFVRFAWKCDGAHGVMIELANNGRWPAADAAQFRYYAGRNSTPWLATEVSSQVPVEWTFVTRDLWKDFGDCTLTGIAPTAMGGAALFDAIQLLRTNEGAP